MKKEETQVKGVKASQESPLNFGVDPKTPTTAAVRRTGPTTATGGCTQRRQSKGFFFFFLPVSNASSLSFLSVRCIIPFVGDILAVGFAL